jgi:hypothetical protein
VRPVHPSVELDSARRGSCQKHRSGRLAPNKLAKIEPCALH